MVINTFFLLINCICSTKFLDFVIWGNVHDPTNPLILRSDTHDYSTVIQETIPNNAKNSLIWEIPTSPNRKVWERRFLTNLICLDFGRFKCSKLVVFFIL